LKRYLKKPEIKENKYKTEFLKIHKKGKERGKKQEN
jgi:hypothetical protein